MTDTADNRARLVASLMRPEAYPHPVDGVEHIATHISDVFLADGFAYKVKKPVNFGFCDFSTRQLREKFTQRELELNQRLSSGVYLSVEEVRFDAGSGEFSVNGAGEAVEPALRMRRLRSEDRLDRLLETGRAGEAEIEEIARLLARFHHDAAPAGGKFASPEQVAEIVLGNIGRVREHGGNFLPVEALADAQGFAEAFLEMRRGLLQERFASGMPRMCHGDLHAGNIFIEEGPLTPSLSREGRGGGEIPPPTPVGGGQGVGPARRVQIIDCIEFNDSLTYIDPAADIAFLSMDLRHSGMAGLAEALTQAYAEASGDRGLSAVLSFYESYRAMVRCLAACISAEQSKGRERRRYRDTALGYLRLATDIAATQKPQLLIVIAGLTGTGKSTMARAIAQQWGAVHLQTDVIRKELAGLSPTARTSDGVREGLYSSEMSRRTYQEMRRRAGLALSGGQSVVMDGTHLKREHRAWSLSIAGPAGVESTVVECTLNEQQALRRLRARYAAGRSESEGRPEVYMAQKPEWEPVLRHEAGAVVRVDTSVTPHEQVETLFRQLWKGILNTVS